MPKISIIIPAYNVEQYIEECLDSILNQTFTDYEVIVVDDCSTDNTYSIIQSYIPKFNNKLTLLKTDKNSGTCSIPRNIGLPYAKGDYIWFIDADDYIAKDALEILYNTAKKYKDSEIIYTSGFFYMIFGKEIHVRDEVNKKLTKEKIIDRTVEIDNTNKCFVETLIDPGLIRFCQAKLVKRQFLINNNIRLYDIPGQDFLWSIEVFSKATKIVRNIIPVYHYRYINDSISHKQINSIEDLTKITNTLVKQIEYVYDLTSRIEYFKQKHNLVKSCMDSYWTRYLIRTREFRKRANDILYQVYLQMFSKYDTNYQILMPFFLALLTSENSKEHR